MIYAGEKTSKPVMKGIMQDDIAKKADDLGLNDPTKNKFLQDPDLEGIDPRESNITIR